MTEPSANLGRSRHCEGHAPKPDTSQVIIGRVIQEHILHIAEGFLPPLQAAAWSLAATPFVIHGARAAIKQVREHSEAKLLLAASGAFTFALTAIKLPSVTGSSSHPTGTGFGAVLFRPPVMAFLATLVLIFQALLLAHGGITTLGANVFSLGVVGPWVAYGVFLVLRRAHLLVAIGCAAAMANLATYTMTSAQLALAFPAEAGGVAAAFGKFMAVFAVSQVPLAIAEGLLAVFMFRLLRDVATPHLQRLGLIPAAPAAPEAVVVAEGGR